MVRMMMPTSGIVIATLRNRSPSSGGNSFSSFEEVLMMNMLGDTWTLTIRSIESFMK